MMLNYENVLGMFIGRPESNNTSVMLWILFVVVSLTIDYIDYILRSTSYVADM